MDPIGTTIIIPPPAQAPVLPTPAPQSGPVLPQPTPTNTSIGGQGAAADVQAAEQQRLEQLTRDIANIFIVSDKSFTIFKDTTGQYITRYTSLRDGTVTYIPAPELLKKHGGASAPVLNIIT